MITVVFAIIHYLSKTLFPHCVFRCNGGAGAGAASGLAQLMQTANCWKASGLLCQRVL